MRSQMHFVCIISLVTGSGCLEDINQLKESQMPRIADTGTLAAKTSLPLGLPPENFNAGALWDYYGTNILEADRQCQGKILRVTGIIRIVGQDDLHRPYVGFQVFDPQSIPAAKLRTLSSKEQKWAREGYPPLVICYLDDSDKDRGARLRQGQAIHLNGRCLGRVKDPSGFKDYVVVLDSCRVEE